jgi:hypothetical protein
MRTLLKICLPLISIVQVFAALPVTTVWEVRPSVGSDNNGGCFDPTLTGTDYSQQNAAQYTFSDLVIAATATNVTSVSHSFISTDVGNCIHISAGTGFTAGWYEIISVATGIATLDRNTGTPASIGGTYFVGGALATLGQLNSNMQSGNTAWVKATATITTTSTIPLNFAGPGANNFPAIQGYTSTRGDAGQVTIQQTSGVNRTVIVSVQALTFANFIIDCNSQTNSGGLLLTANAVRAVNVLVKNCTGTGGNGVGIDMNSEGTYCVQCTATNISNSSGAFVFENSGPSTCIYCVAIANSVTGFAGGIAFPGATCIACVSANNTGASSDGFELDQNQSSSQIIDSVAFGNGRDGFRILSSNYGWFMLMNNISYGNTGVGINYTNGAMPVGVQTFDYNAYGSNTGGNLTNVPAGIHDVTLSANPFVNSSSNNFALNNTSGGGAALWGAGYPGVLALAGTGFADIGTLQHQASGGSGGQHGYPIVQ